MEPMMKKLTQGGMPPEASPSDEKDRERMRKMKKPMTDKEMDEEMKRRKKMGMA